MKNEILESLRPWDCELFEKDPCSPFVCYGGTPKPPKPPKPNFVAEAQRQVQAGVDTTKDNAAGAQSQYSANVAGASQAFEDNKRASGQLGTNISRGLSTGGAALTGFAGSLQKDVYGLGRSLRDTLVQPFMPDQGGGDTGDKSQSSANYSQKGSSKSSSKGGKMGSSKEKMAKRDSLKVRK